MTARSLTVPADIQRGDAVSDNRPSNYAMRCQAADSRGPDDGLSGVLNAEEQHTVDRDRHVVA
jgi:hypothetical protein